MASRARRVQYEVPVTTCRRTVRGLGVRCAATDVRRALNACPHCPSFRVLADKNPQYTRSFGPARCRLAKQRMEHLMNFDRKPRTRLIRCVFAAAAITMTFALGSFIDSLARHYSGEPAQVAQRTIMLVGR